MVDVLMITFNEAVNLPHSLAPLQGWARNIFVVDSGSTDGTPELARSFGAQVTHHDWEATPARRTGRWRTCRSSRTGS